MPSWAVDPSARADVAWPRQDAGAPPAAAGAWGAPQGQAPGPEQAPSGGSWAPPPGYAPQPAYAPPPGYAPQPDHARQPDPRVANLAAARAQGQAVVRNGALWIAAGVGITLFTFLLAPGGFFIISFGPVLCGIRMISRGRAHLAKVAAAERSLRNPGPTPRGWG
jgi:uncharacterized membrane protein